MNDIEMATCTRCDRRLPVTEFYKRREKRSKMGRQSWCKRCQNERINGYRRAVSGERRDEWSIRRRRQLLATYGLTPDDYERLLAEQEGRCAICRRGVDGSLVVDHNHDTGAVRGLLCSPCNIALGGFGDDADRLRSALAYLERTDR